MRTWLVALAVLTAACGSEATTESPRVEGRAGASSENAAGRRRGEEDEEAALAARAQDGSDDESEPEPPSVDRFRALFGSVLDVDDVEPAGAAYELRATVRAAGRVDLGLYVERPHLTPLSRTLVAFPRGTSRALDAELRAVPACVGDQLVIRVPARAPAAEWTEGMPALDEPALPRGLSPAPSPPRPVEALAPTLVDPRTASRETDALVVYWLRAARPGVATIALPLMFGAPDVEVVPARRPVTVRIDLTGEPGVALVEAGQVRVGDRVGLRYLRP